MEDSIARVCSQAKPAHILHNMLGDQSADSMEASGGHPHSIPKCVNQLEDLRGDRLTKNDKPPVCLFVCLLQDASGHRMSLRQARQKS